MQTLELHFTDKSAWGDGPWQYEPDKKQWSDEATGLPCLIVRGPSGALCGYVGIAEEHPWFGRSYSAYSAYDAEAPSTPEDHEISPESVIEVHGGLTFSRFCAEGEPEQGICHRPAEGEPDHVWWFGFDCAHAGDYAPGRKARMAAYSTPAQIAEEEAFEGLGRPTGWGTFIEYRDQAYVEAECARLAQQLAALPAAPRRASLREGR